MWRPAPLGLQTSAFRLEPLGPQHNESDHRAWTGSIDHIRATPGFRPEDWAGDPWPYPMPAEDNLVDLLQHADEFARGVAFAFTVLDPDGEVIGCVYVEPDDSAEARCRMWVRADVAELDAVLESAVRGWLVDEWGLVDVRFPGRDERAGRSTRR